MALKPDTMKRILYIAAIALLTTLVSCEKTNTPKKENLQEKLCKEWHMTDKAVDMEVYVSFMTDGSFELYQRPGTSAFSHYSGTWNLSGNILSGKYSDGTDWGASYEVTFYDKFMELTSQTSIPESLTYELKSIPEEVKGSTAEVRSQSLGILNSQPQYRWL